MIIKVNVGVGFKKPYFCPFCRTLFVKKYNQVEKSSASNKTYKCSEEECKKNFSEYDYEKEAQNGKNYQFPKGCRGNRATVQGYIEKIIIDLWIQGYTNREIHTLTKFSRTMVLHSIQKRTEERQKVTIEEFCAKYLNINENDYKKILERKSSGRLLTLTDELIDSIRKAILFGCTQRQIAKIFMVGYKTISKANTQEYALITDAHLNALDDEERAMEQRRIDKLLVKKEGKVSFQKKKKNKIRITDENMVEIIRLNSEQ